MKRKAEVTNAVEAKIPSLSPFIKEESLPIDGIETDVEEFIDFYDTFVKELTEKIDSKERFNLLDSSKFILKFKELNRKAQFRLSLSREKTKETKDSINKNHLLMQNLLYEALHIHNETTNCLEYKSLHDEISLIPVETFEEDAPIKFKNYANEHDLTLNRLYWELEERKKLALEIQEAEKTEVLLNTEISKKRQAYKDIANNLNMIYEASRGLEEIFDLRAHDHEQQSELVSRLAEPLYSVYVQWRVLADTGNCCEARVTLREEADSIFVEVHLSGLVAAPDSIQLVLDFRWDSGAGLVRLMARHEDMTEFLTSHSLASISRSVLDADSLMKGLVRENDDGAAPAIRARLETAAGAASSVPGQSLVWCQLLAAVFCPEMGPTASQVPPCLPTIVASLSARLSRRLALARDLTVLTASSGPCPALRSWTNSGNHIDTTNVAVTLTATLLSPRHQRDLLSVTVTVPVDYPVSAPRVRMATPELPASSYPDTVLASLRMVEVETNCFCQELQQASEDSNNQDTSGGLLTRQMVRLVAATELMLDWHHAGTLNQRVLIAGKFPVSHRPFLV